MVMRQQEVRRQWQIIFQGKQDLQGWLLANLVVKHSRHPLEN
jgi:hypothetical protein